MLFYSKNSLVCINSGILVSAIKPFLYIHCFETKFLVQHVLKSISQLVFSFFNYIVIYKVLQFIFQIFSILKIVNSYDSLIRNKLFGFFNKTIYSSIFIFSYNTKSSWIFNLMCPNYAIFSCVQCHICIKESIRKSNCNFTLQAFFCTKNCMSCAKWSILIIDFTFCSKILCYLYKHLFNL